MPIPVGTGIVGPASTGQFTGQFDLLPDVQRDVTFYDLQSAIIMTFLMAINRTEKASQPLFNWKEDQADYPSYTCTSAIPITAAGTPFAMTVAYGRVVPGDTVTEPYSNQTFEWQTISSQNATTTVGTVLQVPSTAATTAVSGGALLINQGMHMVEGGAFPQGIGQIPLNVSNITAIKAGAVEVTYSMFNSETFWGNEYEYNKRARITQWRGDMERDLIWGKLVQEQRTQTSNGFTVTNQMRQSLGILGRITSNKDVYTPPVSEGTLNNFVRQTVWGSRNSGSRQKLGACGPLLMGGIDDVAITKLRYLEKANVEYGINVQVYMGYGGRKLYLVEEKEFYDNPAFENTMLVLDPGYLKIRYLGPSMMQVVDATQPGLAKYKIAFYSEHGVEMRAQQFASLLSTQ